MTLRFRFQRVAFQLVLATCVAAPVLADPVITEFMASNTKTLADADGDYPDWIELYNPDAAAFNLDGWYLTDSASNKDKWKFPAVSIQAGSYLVVFASNKNKKDLTKPLHTNFTLEAEGKYLALVKPDGLTVASEFAPKFPVQYSDISYGVTQPTAAGEVPLKGYFRASTPGARNGGANTLMPTERVTFSRPSGPFAGSTSLTMTGATAGQRIRYVIAPPATAGATVAEPTATSPEYTGPITLNASSLICAAVFSADNSQRGLSTTAHFPRLANSGIARLDTFTSQLPLLVIDTHGTGDLVKASGEKFAWTYSWDRPAAGSTSLTAAPTAGSFGATNVRGASSADFPKKSFALKLTNTSGEANAVGLYGLPAFDNWTLIGPWSVDRTFIHNVFTYELSNRIGRWAPRTQLVELFFNANGGDLDYNDYAGVYVVTDALKVDPKRVAITAIDPGDNGSHSITGGYLLKNDLADPDEFSFTTKHGLPGAPFSVIVASPKLADMPKAQRDYIQGNVQGFEDALFTDFANGFQKTTYLDYIDRSSFVDHHILNAMTANVDAFFRSAYMTKDRDGRLSAGPMWDNDRTMNGGDDRTKRPDIWDGGEGATPLWVFGWWGLLARDVEFMQAWIDRWQSLRRTEFSTASLTALVDASAAQIGAAAAARDAVKWPDAGGGGNTPRFSNGWQGEIDNMKTWLTQRVAWIDSQFIAPPTVVNTAGSLVITPAPGTQLVYTTDGTDPRWSGGKPSLAAKFSSSPITVADSLDVQARSYKADFDPAIVPGSPWSGPVGGPKSSPLSPAPRLSNLSSRGFVGTGENVMITGVYVSETAGKQYLARAVGPTLTAFGVGGALAAPVLTILDKDGKEIAKNSEWQKGPGTDDVPDYSTAVGAFPLTKNSKDAALVAKLPAGQYTLQISSANSSTGVALAEFYEIDAGTGRTVNLSTRGLVRAGEGLLIGGVVVRGPAPKRLLVRAIGPTLAAFGVAATLPDPVLTIFDSAQKIVATNDDWNTTATGAASATDITTAAGAVGAFQLVGGSKDAVLLLTLPAGGYTVQVTGKGAAEGIILLEIYEVP